MKSLLKKENLPIILGLSLVLSAGEAAAAAAVLPIGKRLSALKTAEQTIERQKAAWSVALDSITDPFFRISATPEAQPVAEIVQAQRPERSADEILQAVAPSITPTGTMLIGNQEYLLIGGRRYRVGDQISVSFEEKVYAVQIASIERNSYTLRLNQSELRRDFK